MQLFPATAKPLWEPIKQPADEKKLRSVLYVGNQLGTSTPLQISGQTVEDAPKSLEYKHFIIKVDA